MSKRNIPRQSPNVSSTHSAGQSLFTQLLEIGQQLLEKDPELYKTAVAHLHANQPREPSPVRRAAGAEQKGVKGDHGRRSSTAFHKYNLPGDAGMREYYQCMICSERRTTNSFHADHQHEGQKLSVRWYCPLCDTLYAVTHRGYHIKNRHKSPAVKKGGGANEPMVKDESEEEEEEEEEEENENESELEPPTKRGNKRSNEDDDTSVASDEQSSANVLATFGKPPPPPITGVMPAPIVAPPNITPVPTPRITEQVSMVNTEAVPITHTVTQEALLGGPATITPMQSMQSSEQFFTATVIGADSGKLLFPGNSATITRQ